jgi:hypothetical protein
MVCLPAAVVKAVFDLVWDLCREKRTSNEGERIGVEDGIELHHTNGIPQSPSRVNKKNSIEGPRVETDGGNNEIRSETISLGMYLKLRPALDSFIARFPVFSGTLRRLPYALLPFALSQFILVEALAYTGWINVFSTWLAIVVGFSLPATVFVVGIISVILCNCSGTNVGATILLVKILRHPNFANRPGIPPKLRIGGMLSLAVGSNIGAVSFTFSASLAGFHTSCIINDRFALARDSVAKGYHRHGQGIRQVEYATLAIYDRVRLCCRPSCRYSGT